MVRKAWNLAPFVPFLGMDQGCCIIGEGERKEEGVLGKGRGCPSRRCRDDRVPSGDYFGPGALVDTRVIAVNPSEILRLDESWIEVGLQHCDVHGLQGSCNALVVIRRDLDDGGRRKNLPQASEIPPLVHNCSQYRADLPVVHG
jgi:hypothetical protein